MIPKDVPGSKVFCRRCDEWRSAACWHPSCPLRALTSAHPSSVSDEGALQALVPAREDPDEAQSAENADVRGGEQP